MIALCLVVALVATPFEDTQRRFTVDLPQQWAFAPQPGDTGGATFRRVAEGALANAMVRVLPFNQPVDLNAVVAKIAMTYSEEPGYRLLISEPCRLGNNTAQRRRFVTWINGDPKLVKISEQRITVLGTVGYVVHVESMAETFSIFESDFDALFASFLPAGMVAAGAAIPFAPVGVPPSRHVDRRGMTGIWETQGARHALRLSPGGIVILDGARGHYHVDHGMLVMDFTEGGERMFEFELDGRRLRLRGSTFAAGEIFYKVHRRPEAVVKPPARGVPPVGAVPP